MRPKEDDARTGFATRATRSSSSSTSRCRRSTVSGACVRAHDQRHAARPGAHPPPRRRRHGRRADRGDAGRRCRLRAAAGGDAHGVPGRARRGRLRRHPRRLRAPVLQRARRPHRGPGPTARAAVHLLVRNAGRRARSGHAEGGRDRLRAEGPPLAPGARGSPRAGGGLPTRGPPPGRERPGHQPEVPAARDRRHSPRSLRIRPPRAADSLRQPAGGQRAGLHAAGAVGARVGHAVDGHPPR